MSVVGIDFGALHSKIGVARHRGIDIIINEVSNRATPIAYCRSRTRPEDAGRSNAGAGLNEDNFIWPLRKQYAQPPSSVGMQCRRGEMEVIEVYKARAGGERGRRALLSLDSIIASVTYRARPPRLKNKENKDGRER
ncbi:hypothetical protein NUW54_g13684 [Trametes sanguinea]|uniref:Uncharacterized protein n=1 Tax=Trametes sanguinea TaxID=158606 RepID=A0ACC1MIM1_9APHY|nr:hypothetical protein NUW54_g13684 [Trametes sanguinea]